LLMKEVVAVSSYPLGKLGNHPEMLDFALLFNLFISASDLSYTAPLPPLLVPSSTFAKLRFTTVSKMTALIHYKV
jgi:hypothetical protein